MATTTYVRINRQSGDDTGVIEQDNVDSTLFSAGTATYSTVSDSAGWDNPGYMLVSLGGTVGRVPWLVNT